MMEYWNDGAVICPLKPIVRYSNAPVCHQYSNIPSFKSSSEESL
jgi:hypothetical protein